MFNICKFGLNKWLDLKWCLVGYKAEPCKNIKTGYYP